MLVVPFLTLTFGLIPFIFNVVAGLVVSLVELPFCCNMVKCCVDLAARLVCLRSGTLRAPLFLALAGFGLYVDFTTSSAWYFYVIHAALGGSGALYLLSACSSDSEEKEYDAVAEAA